MASQITHVIYGQRVLDRFLDSGKNVNLRDYFIGTLFPDIRFLGTVSREKTHVTPPSLDDLFSIKSSFYKGFYMHLLTDTERERLLDKFGFYKFFPVEQNVQRASKLLEDILVWRHRENWKEIIDYLDNVLEEELEFTDEQTVRRWHQILATYFQKSPSIDSAISLAETLGFPENLLTDIIRWMKKISRSKEATIILASIHQKLFYE